MQLLKNMDRASGVSAHAPSARTAYESAATRSEIGFWIKAGETGRGASRFPQPPKDRRANRRTLGHGGRSPGAARIHSHCQRLVTESGLGAKGWIVGERAEKED